jgi:hypothetical protein
LLLNIPEDTYYLNIVDTVAGIPISILKKEIVTPAKGIIETEVLVF